MRSRNIDLTIPPVKLTEALEEAVLIIVIQL